MGVGEWLWACVDGGVAVGMCGCDCEGDEESVWVEQP